MSALAVQQCSLLSAIDLVQCSALRIKICKGVSVRVKYVLVRPPQSIQRSIRLLSLRSEAGRSWRWGLQAYDSLLVDLCQHAHLGHRKAMCSCAERIERLFDVGIWVAVAGWPSVHTQSHCPCHHVPARRPYLPLLLHACRAPPSRADDSGATHGCIDEALLTAITHLQTNRKPCSSSPDLARLAASMPFKLETKAHQAVYDVDHRTLKASAGGILSDVKVEYLPNFTIRGSPLEFGLKGTEQTLLQPRQAKDLVAEAKCKVRPGLSAAARYAVGKRLAAYDIKAVRLLLHTNSCRFIQC